MVEHQAVIFVGILLSVGYFWSLKWNAIWFPSLGFPTATCPPVWGAVLQMILRTWTFFWGDAPSPETKFGESYWKPPFLGDMLVLGSVSELILLEDFGKSQRRWKWFQLRNLPDAMLEKEKTSPPQNQTQQKSTKQPKRTSNNCKKQTLFLFLVGFGTNIFKI